VGKLEGTLMERKCANYGGAHVEGFKKCKDFVAERVQELAMKRQ
jgi:hypothetical protein